MKFHLKTPLFDEPVEPQGGGGAGAPEPPDMKALFGEFQKTILGELDKRVNGINKEFKAQTKAMSSGFDAFKTEIVSSFQKPTDPPNSDDDDDDDDAQTAAARAAAAAAAGAPPKGQQQEPPRPPKKNQPSPHEQRLQRELEALRAKQEETQKLAEKREREAEAKEISGSLKEAIAKHPFNNDRGAGDFFSLLRQSVVRGDDGSLYGPEGKTLDEYVADEYAGRPYYHPPKAVNGSGAGAPANGGSGGRGIEINDIGPNMTAEQLNNVAAAIAGIHGGKYA